MGKVQFNCRLSESTVEAINEERQRLSDEEGRAVSQAEVLERIVPTHSFTRFRDILEPVVYGWRRGDSYLYIGYSKNGLRRACEPEHHVIGKVEAVGDDDVLDLWVCKSVVDARDLERRMIGKFRPEHNQAVPATENGESRTKLTNFRLHYECVDILETLASFWRCNLTEALNRSLQIAEAAVIAAPETTGESVREPKPTALKVSGRAESVAQRKAREAKEHA